MGYRTVEVELEDGRVSPVGGESLPLRAHALLTLLEPATSDESLPARNCGELAERWERLEKLSVEESNAFANDLETARQALPPLKSAWDC